MHGFIYGLTIADSMMIATAPNTPGAQGATPFAMRWWSAPSA